MKYFTEEGKPKRKPKDLCELSEMWQEKCTLLEKELSGYQNRYLNREVEFSQKWNDSKIELEAVKKESAKKDRVIRKLRKFINTLKLEIHNLTQEGK